MTADLHSFYFQLNTFSQGYRSEQIWQPYFPQPDIPYINTKEFYNNLLSLEDIVATNHYTLEIIRQLTEYYAELVEFFDQEEQPIKYYFMDKMKNSLANQESLKLMQMQKQINKRQQLVKLDSFLLTNQNLQDIPEQISPQTKGRSRSSYCISPQFNNLKQVEKLKKMQIFLTVEKEKQKQNEISTFYVNYFSNTTKIDDIIQQNINDQENKFQKRLNKKKTIREILQSRQRAQSEAQEIEKARDLIKHKCVSFFSKHSNEETSNSHQELQSNKFLIEAYQEPLSSSQILENT